MSEKKDFNSSLDPDTGKKNLEANLSILTDGEKKLAKLLVDAGQVHVFAPWPAPGNRDADKKRLLAQAALIEDVYPGGMKNYVANAKELLEKSRTHSNPYEGYVVSEPSDSVRLETPDDFKKWEARGMNETKDTAFVIVAGGLGERLGYKGIKVALPAEITTGKPYLQLYIEHILAFQARSSSVVPLGIMTSDDTDKLTRELLEKNNYFGMDRKALTVFKQGKVPALLDNDGHFALEAEDPFQIDTKPHGHGDVHTLLYQHRLVEKWVKEQNKKWVVFFQDTNGLVFRAVPAALGVSAEYRLSVNSITVPRVQGDAVGAICKLSRDAKKMAEAKTQVDMSLPSPLTINVEYNQLEGLLGKGAQEPTVKNTNISVYPGNINVLIFNAPEYLKILEAKKGIISEFVNPKYKAGTNNTVFNKPTRLECMMQDYPKLLDDKARVGFTQFERWTSFSAVKNTLADGAAKQKTNNAAECACTGEADMYLWSRKMFEQAKARVGPMEDKTYGGVKVQQGARIVLSPSFGVTQAEVLSKLHGGDKIKITKDSTLILEGSGIELDSLDLDGTLIVRAAEGTKVQIKDLTIKNKGWHFTPVDVNDQKVDQKYGIRGYQLGRDAEDEFVFTSSGSFTLSDSTKQSAPKAKPASKA